MYINTYIIHMYASLNFLKLLVAWCWLNLSSILFWCPHDERCLYFAGWHRRLWSNCMVMTSSLFICFCRFLFFIITEYLIIFLSIEFTIFAELIFGLLE